MQATMVTSLVVTLPYYTTITHNTKEIRLQFLHNYYMYLIKSSP
jgi:hypothetical protein